MKIFSLLLLAVLLTGFIGCETVHKAGNAAGSAVGEGANAVGSVTEGGAGAVQGRTTSEENPYNR